MITLDCYWFDFRGKVIKYHSRPEFWRTVESGTWESHSFDILDKYIEKDKVFIDVGCWTGVLSIYAALLGAKVYAIEPDNYLEAEENFKLNNLDIKLSNLALSYSKGYTAMCNPVDDFGNSESTILKLEQSSKFKQVPTDTLEGFIERENIDPKEICLIKIDTEGSELFILPSSKTFLEKYKPKIYLSMHPLYIAEKGLRAIANTIYPIYQVMTVSGKEIAEENFIEAMKNNENHALLLLPK